MKAKWTENPVSKGIPSIQKASQATLPDKNSAPTPEVDPILWTGQRLV